MSGWILATKVDFVIDREIYNIYDSSRVSLNPLPKKKEVFRVIHTAAPTPTSARNPNPARFSNKKFSLALHEKPPKFKEGSQTSPHFLKHHQSQDMAPTDESKSLSNTKYVRFAQQPSHILQMSKTTSNLHSQAPITLPTETSTLPSQIFPISNLLTNKLKVNLNQRQIDKGIQGMQGMQGMDKGIENGKKIDKSEIGILKDKKLKGRIISEVNLRRYPKWESASVRTIKIDSEVHILSMSQNKAWTEVMLYQKKKKLIGWVPFDHLELIPSTHSWYKTLTNLKKEPSYSKLVKYQARNKNYEVGFKVLGKGIQSLTSNIVSIQGEEESFFKHINKKREVLSYQTSGQRMRNVIDNV